MKAAALDALRSIAVVVLAGVVMAVVLFVLTSLTEIHASFGPGVGTQVVAMPGFDPWTGEPHGMVYDRTSMHGPATTTRITAEPRG